MNIIRLVLPTLLAFWAGTLPAQTRVLTCGKDDAKMSYTVVHPLHEMVAVSTDVVYHLTCDTAAKSITGVNAFVDVTTFDSGNSNRDSHAMEVVDALTYPEARFTSTAIDGKGDSLAVRGMLFFHGVSREIVIPTRAEWLADRISVNAAFAISMNDFKIDRPSLLMIPVNDTIHFAVSALFRLQ